MKTPLALGLLLMLLLSSLPGHAQTDGAVKYELFLDCPVGNGFSFSLGTRPGCPVHAVDADDAMGDPSLAVDPLDPRNLIIASLHAQVDGEGPTVKSRSPYHTLYNQPFTTFTSTDGGAYWNDSPFRPPGELGGAYGETPAVTIDPYGHVYVGSLYAVDEGAAFRYVIAAQKFGSLHTIREEQDGEYNVQYIDPVFPGGQIRQMWFLFNAQTDNMTMVWHEDPGASTPPPPVNGSASGSSGAASPGLPLALPGPRPAAAAPAGAATAVDALAHIPDALRVRSEDASAEGVPPVRGTIGVVWTDPSRNASYHRQPIEWSIGPCMRSTNPVIYEGLLYVGCQTDPAQGEFLWNPRTQAGQVELFRMHPDGGKPEYMGSSPILGGTPKLGVRSDGRLALFTTDATSEGQLALNGAFGRYDSETGGIAWSGVISYGLKVRPIDVSEVLVRSNIQDLVYREYSGVVHLILRETIQPAGIGVDALQKALLPKIRKSILAIDEKEGLLAVLPLDIGNPLNRTDPQLLEMPEMAFEDLSDDFLQLPAAPYTYDGQPLGDTYQRQFFAVGDYGTIMFAELVEVTELRFVPVFTPPVVAVGIPSAATSITSTVVASVGASLAAITALSMVANRRKNPAAALAKMKKK